MESVLGQDRDGLWLQDEQADQPLKVITAETTPQLVATPPALASSEREGRSYGEVCLLYLSLLSLSGLLSLLLSQSLLLPPSYLSLFSILLPVSPFSHFPFSIPLSVSLPLSPCLSLSPCFSLRVILLPGSLVADVS